MPTIWVTMNTTARMKGNRSSAGETLPGAPLERAPAANPGETFTSNTSVSPAKQRLRWRRRAILVPAMALIVAAGLVVALVVAMSGGNAPAASTASQGEDPSLALALPGTPTPVPEPTETPADVPATVADTAAAPVRVRYEITTGDSCDLVRQKFGFSAAESADFSTALSRISGRTPANQCTFGQGDVVCVPTAADLEQLDRLTRDTGCLLGGTPAASGT